jgi:hypothetical protein
VVQSALIMPSLFDLLTIARRSGGLNWLPTVHHDIPYSWSNPLRPEIFRVVVIPAIASASSVYLLNNGLSFTDRTGQYATEFVQWINQEYPSQFETLRLDAGRGLDLIRFTRRTKEWVARVPENVE